MRTICKVAFTELRTLFYSPVAWLLLVAFFIQCGLAYFDAVKLFADIQQRGGEELKYLGNLTYQVFSNPAAVSSVLPAVTKNLYLYLPLLTMGLLSREVSSGTIKLLYSSPVKASQVVLGKYLSMMILGALFVVIAGFFMLSGMLHIRHADGGFLWPSLIGVYLLVCAYSAIGLFMSSLTTYQIVAAAGSFVIFGLLRYVGNIWQGYNLLGDIAYFLSVNGRTQNFFSGLISSRDIIYFGVIICMFLGFTICYITSQRTPARAFTKAGKYVLTLLAGVVIIYASSQPALSFYYDATRTKVNTLTPNAQKVMAGLKGAPLEIISYNNVLASDAFYGHPQFVKRVMANWDRYVRFKPDIQLRMINYYDEPLDNPYNPFSKQYPSKTLQQVANQVALTFGVYPSDFVSPEQLHKTIDLTPEMNRFVMLLRWKDKSTFLRVYNDIERWPSETEV
ncbi:MAG TPA: ABC transporter permease subunit, partial [Chitinophaga sp.]